MPQNNLTLKELLRLSYSGPITWLSGEERADVFVQWVALRLDGLQPGDILFSSGDKLTSKKLSKFCKRGGSAVILESDLLPNHLDFPDELPVLAISADTDPCELYRNMLTILINQRAYLMERGVRVHAQLSQLAAKGEGLSELAKSMYELSGRGILVQDKRLMVLAEYPSSTLLYIWDEVLDQLLDKDNLPAEFLDRKKIGKYTNLQRQILPGDLERIIIPISVDGVARGYLSLVDVKGMLDTLDFLVAEQGALVCAIEMSRAKAVREAEKRLKGNLLTALLQENITPRDANLWVQDMGLDLTQAHVAIRFAWDSTTSMPPSMRRLETLVNGEISNKNHRAIVETMGSEVVCICELAPRVGRPDAALALGEAIIERAKEEYAHIPARCGIGTVTGDMGEWRVSFRQSGQALEMARRLQEKRPLYYPDLSVYRLLLQLENHIELRTFKKEILGSLIEYEGGGDLIHTLEVFFEHNGNQSKAAEALFIHRNTMTYRMERIAEITGLDLENTETRLAAHLALQVHKMLDQ